VQRNPLNHGARFTIVVPITDARANREIPSQFEIAASELGLDGKDSVADVVCLRQIDQSRIKSDKPISTLSTLTMSRIDDALCHVLDLHRRT
jgi:mRNA-degrading endonuclease toxin of MazEF toxin-antitoxin module